MKATLRYRYAWLEHIKLRLKKKAIGTMALKNIRLVTRTRLSPLSKFVLCARTRVAIVAKTKCHVVRKIALMQSRLNQNSVLADIENREPYGNLMLSELSAHMCTRIVAYQILDCGESTY